LPAADVTDDAAHVRPLFLGGHEPTRWCRRWRWSLRRRRRCFRWSWSSRSLCGSGRLARRCGRLGRGRRGRGRCRCRRRCWCWWSFLFRGRLVLFIFGDAGDLLDVRRLIRKRRRIRQELVRATSAANAGRTSAHSHHDHKQSRASRHREDATINHSPDGGHPESVCNRRAADKRSSNPVRTNGWVTTSERFRHDVRWTTGAVRGEVDTPPPSMGYCAA
jgi:hypothetical protein